MLCKSDKPSIIIIKALNLHDLLPLLLLQISNGLHWALAPPSAAFHTPLPVERGTVAFVAQSATCINTHDLRKSGAYDHELEDVKVCVGGGGRHGCGFGSGAIMA